MIAATRDPKQDLIEEVRNLKRKARLLQFCHGQMTTMYSRRDRLLSLGMTIAAGIAATATAAEFRLIFVREEALSLITAVVTILLFLLTLVRFELQWASKKGEHQTALKSFTRFIRQLDITIETLESKKLSDLEQVSKGLAEEYSNICDASPHIESQHFLGLKKQHLEEIAISRELDKHPFMSIKQIREELRQKSNLSSLN